MSEVNKIIITAAICTTFCLSITVNSIMFGWEATRRTGEEIAIIKSPQIGMAELREQSAQRKEQVCIKGGGMPKYDDRGDFWNCQKNK